MRKHLQLPAAPNCTAARRRCLPTRSAGLSLCACSALTTATAALWEVVEDHIAPLEVLRRTVEGAQSRAPDAARDLCLLLDPTLCDDSVQRLPLSRECRADVLPGWGPIPPASYVTSGHVWTCSLPAPPLCTMAPTGPCPILVKDAIAYSTWLEGACRVLAEAIAVSASRPVAVHCPGFRAALGPAALWLSEAGFVEQTSRVSSPVALWFHPNS